jgi:macrodomain Ter protein organizer (MatP/YcbG family)
MNEEKTEQKLTIRFPYDVWQRLKSLAKEDGRSFNGEVIWILRQYITERSEREAPKQ